MREKRPSPSVIARGERAGRSLAVALGVAAVALSFLPQLGGSPVRGTPVEVRGEVPAPGLYLVDPPTLALALAAAGSSVQAEPRLVDPGDIVEVTDGRIEVRRSDRPLLFGLPVDVDEDTEEEIAAIPGVGASVAHAIVAARPFWSVDDLRRARGVGPALLEDMRRYVTTGLVGPRPLPRTINVNRASVAELEELPGIGPALARRIALDRTERGLFRSIADLDRVKGIGPATVARLRSRATASP